MPEKIFIFQSKKLFRESAYFIFLIFILNTLDHFFYLSSSIWWFDMPMHFLGGFWLGLLALSLIALPQFQKWHFDSSFWRLIATVIIFVLTIGLLWEAFEFILQGLTGLQLANPLDSASDLCFDIAGGFFSGLYSMFFGLVIYKKAVK